MDHLGNMTPALVNLISRLMDDQETNISLMESYLFPDVDSGVSTWGGGDPEDQEALKRLLSRYIKLYGVPVLVEKLLQILGQDFEHGLRAEYRQFRRHDDYQYGDFL